MKQRFVILVDNPTKEQQNRITQFFKSQPTGYWHWFSDAWLITDTTGEWAAGSIRSKIQELVPGIDTLVLKVDNDKGWAGFGKKEKFAWLFRTWTD